MTDEQITPEPELEPEPAAEPPDTVDPNSEVVGVDILSGAGNEPAESESPPAPPAEPEDE